MNGTFSGLFKVGDARSGGGEVSIVFANKHNDDLTRRRLEATQGCGPAAYGGSFTKKSPLILAMAASVALALSGCGGGGDAPATGGDTMTGGGDTMTGGGDTMTGGGDTMTGGGDTMTGGGDTMTGGGDVGPCVGGRRRWAMTGGGDTMTGGGDTMTGGGDTMTGGGDTMTGGGDTMTGGVGDTMTGGGDTMTGGGDTMTGGGDTMTGGGDTMTGTPIDMERELEKRSQIFADATRFEPSPTFVGSITYEPAYFATSRQLATQPTEPAGEFRAFYINKDANFNPVEYDGVTIGSDFFVVRADELDNPVSPNPDISLEEVYVYVYGGWMDYNYFEVMRISGDSLNTETGAHTRTDIVLAYSLGSESGSNPMAVPGSATWEGAALGEIMGYQSKSGAYVGTEFNTSSNLTFNSDATIVVDFSNETLDARFDNFTISDPILHDDAEGEIGEIAFLDIPYYFGQFVHGMPLTGIFPWAPTQGLELNEMKGIAGAFYGPNHEEVGGSFFATTRRPTEQVIVGAFGAERQ